MKQNELGGRNQQATSSGSREAQAAYIIIEQEEGIAFFIFIFIFSDIGNKRTHKNKAKKDMNENVEGGYSDIGNE